MKLRFLAVGNNADYSITQESVNGIDLSVIPTGVSIDPLPDILYISGIRAVERDEGGELWVTLTQPCTSYEYKVQKHNWTESGWIDFQDYDPTTCYIIPSSVQGRDDYELVFRDTEEKVGWTVVRKVLKRGVIYDE